MGVLDGNAFDWSNPDQATYTSPSGLLGPALPPWPGASPSLRYPATAPTNLPAPPPPAALPQAGATGRSGGGDGNPFAPLFSGIGNLFAPSSAGAAAGPSLGDRANAALMNFANAHGVLPALAGAITGVATGERTDPIGIAQAQQAATMQALAGAGIPSALAQAAARDPYLMRMLAPALYQKLAAANAAGAAPTAPAAAK